MTKKTMATAAAAAGEKDVLLFLYCATLANCINSQLVQCIAILPFSISLSVSFSVWRL